MDPNAKVEESGDEGEVPQGVGHVGVIPGVSQKSGLTVSEEQAAHKELSELILKEGLRLELKPGVFATRYEMGSAVGKGKFSTVFKGVRRVDGQSVAIKEIAIFDVMDLKSRKTCLKEIRLVQGLDHPHIIKYMDGFVEGRALILVFEFAEAGDLKRQLRKAREKGVRFEERVVWRYFAQIVDAVAHMHSRRILHRDLKPANIFLTLAGVVKVGDLGLGRLLSDTTMVAHSKVGTPLYMAPETLKGGGHDQCADVWSLGCILYELFTLVSPFKEEGLNLYGLFQKIMAGRYAPMEEGTYSPQAIALVKGMLQQNPSDRPDITFILEVANKMRAAFGSSRGLKGVGGADTTATAAPPVHAPVPAAATVSAFPPIHPPHTSSSSSSLPLPPPPFVFVDSAGGMGGDAVVEEVVMPPAAAAASAASASAGVVAGDSGIKRPASGKPHISPDSELSTLCQVLPLEASNALMERLQVMGFFAPTPPPPPPPPLPPSSSPIPHSSLTRIHEEGKKWRDVMNGCLPRLFFALPNPTLPPSLHFSTLLYTLRWLSHAAIGGNGGGGGGGAALAAAMDTLSSRHSPATPLVTAQGVASALGVFSGVLASHFSNLGPSILLNACGPGVLVPLLILAEAGVGARGGLGGWGRGDCHPMMVPLLTMGARVEEGIDEEVVEEEEEEEVGGRDREGKSGEEEEEEEEEELLLNRQVGRGSTMKGVWVQGTGGTASGRGFLPPLPPPAISREAWEAEVQYSGSRLGLSGGSGRGSSSSSSSRGSKGREGGLTLGGGGEWRDRVGVIRTLGKVFQGAAHSSAVPSERGGVMACFLAGLREDLGEVGGFEGAMNGVFEGPGGERGGSSSSGSSKWRAFRATLTPTLSTLSTTLAKVKSHREAVEAARARILEASSALSSLEEVLEGVGEQVEARTLEHSSNTGVLRVKEALGGIRRESGELEVQLGVARSLVGALHLRRTAEERARVREEITHRQGGSRNIFLVEGGGKQHQYKK